jgi:ADP-ribosylglycohydrolase
MIEARNLLSARFAEIIRAYAAGDAYGVQFEFQSRRFDELPDQLVEVDGWPAGGVSDDTILSLMTLESLLDSIRAKATQLKPGASFNTDTAALTSAESFHSRLLAAKENLRGLGPTTRAALGLLVKPEEQAMVGRSNGGLMRCSLVGLAFADNTERRMFVRALTEVTHRHPRAVEAALVGSRLLSDAITAGGAFDIAAAVREECPEFADEILGFEPTADGVTLDPIETLGASIRAGQLARSTNDAFKIACGFGGDTDTTAALAGALFTAMHPNDNAFEQITWLPQVEWAEIPQLQTVASELAGFRLVR